MDRISNMAIRKEGVYVFVNDNPLPNSNVYKIEKVYGNGSIESIDLGEDEVRDLIKTLIDEI